MQYRIVSTASERLKRAPAAYYRGGTSRAIMFKQEDLPPDRKDWAPIFLGAIGSPDSNGRQLDGMGGGLSSLSKICVIGKCADSEIADVDYTFAAIGIKDTDVDYSSNCGNMTSAVGPFAIDSGLVESPSDGDTTIRIRNTNTNKIIHSTFPVVDGEAEAHGDFAIDGVSGTASRIQLAFINPAGSRTGKLLPTSNSTDIIDDVKVSLVDCGNPCCFVSAEELGVDGTTLPDAIEKQPELLRILDSIRRQASVLMGLSKDAASATGSVPKIAMVSRPSTHQILSGDNMDKEEVDLVVRAISVGQPHRAVPITVAMAIAAAAKVEGSVVQQLAEKGRNADRDGFTLGHSSGKIVVGANFAGDGTLKDVIVYRTARRLMDGMVYWK
ncbi:DUF453-domain-containing protein [Mollisia scopiformis]|uniref:DUF453-domain-containing protein n=1 Tax=Mollisia scopiformis TaxID=149040 RepID=A0A194WWQ7_MOLSC|nr:DUF453-domain-containing protein [Mollisia scopiformis]KUJ12408.1 DUF453-domain-containing protein [Mollisia scopiformis]